MDSEAHTFVFADLAGFTALTEIHGDDRAADLAMQFCRGVCDLLPPDAHGLKMIGDACLVRLNDPGEAVRLGLALTDQLASRHGFLDIRVGMNTGPAVRRGDEWFGKAINIASRVASLAGPGQVLLTAATADAMADDCDTDLIDSGFRQLRHVSEPVHLYRASAPTPNLADWQWFVDPVCHMRLGGNQRTLSATHLGRVVHFCSRECADAFLAAPDRYQAVPARQAVDGMNALRPGPARPAGPAGHAEIVA